MAKDSDPNRDEGRSNSTEGGSRPKDGIRVYPLGTMFVWGVLIAFVLAFFRQITFVLLLFLGAAALAALLAPLKRRFPGPRWVGGLLSGGGFTVLALGLIVLLGWSITGPVKEQLQRWPEMKKNLDQSLRSLADRFGIETQVNVDEVMGRLFNWLTGEGSALAKAVDAFTLVILSFTLIFFGMLYLLTERSSRLVDPLDRLLSDRMPSLRDVIGTLELRLRWWLLGTTISMVVAGTFAGVGFALIGLEFALPLALLAGFAELVPTLGPVITFLVALLLAATQGTTQVVGVAVVYVLTQFLESYVLIPVVMRETVRMPPVVTLFTVVLWGRLFGALGLLLAIPIDILIWTALDEFYLRPSRQKLARDPSPG